MKLKRFVILVVAAVALALSASEVSAQLCARECDESGWYADTTVSGITYFGQTTWGLQCTDFGTEGSAHRRPRRRRRPDEAARVRRSPSVGPPSESTCEDHGARLTSSSVPPRAVAAG
jgi:hypothetical protein